MNIYWLGHSSFLIKTSIGKRILTDPFDIDIGYVPYKSSVDLITISHLHFDHCCTKFFDNGTRIINKVGKYELDFCTVSSFPSFHDNCGGIKRGDNIIFKYEVDGFVLCHLGDLGHCLDASISKNIGYIDVLFIPVGDHFTLNLDNVKKVIKQLSPRYIIPMHYKTKNLSFPLEGVDKFLMEMKEVKKVSYPCLSLTKDTLPNESTIVILDVFKNNY